MKKIVLTGAAGRLGSYLREPLTSMADELVSTDIVDDIGKTYKGETYQQGDLASLDDMLRVLEGAEIVVHMGAYADEGPFEGICLPQRFTTSCVRQFYSCCWYVPKKRIYQH